LLPTTHPSVENDSLCLESFTTVVPCAVTPLGEETTCKHEDELTKTCSQESPVIESHPGQSSKDSECDSEYIGKPNSKRASATDNDACPGPSCVPSTTIPAVKNLPPPEHKGELNYIST